MKRRDAIVSAAALGAAPLAAAGKINSNIPQNSSRELYELRTYDMIWGTSSAVLKNYLTDVLKPHLMKKGVTFMKMYSEYGMNSPEKIWVLITYPSADTFIASKAIHADPDFQKDSAEYTASTREKMVFDRYRSSISHAIEGLPQMHTDIDASGLLELRIYEGKNENATRRKIEMFNNEELDLFYETKLNPVLFGNMVIGENCPSLVYMLHFKDMEERDANWKTFIDHPEWKRMVALPKYADTVSNIIRVFLEPLT